MAETYSVLPLSGSTDYAPISITGTVSSAATTIHAPGTGTVVQDEVWIKAYNPGTAAAHLTIQHGGTGSAYQIPHSIPVGGGMYACYAGEMIRNSLPITGFSTSVVKPHVIGRVNRITTS